MTGALGAFLFLFWCTVRNRLSAQAQRLRSPRYLLAVAVALGYFVFLLYRPAQDAVDASPIMRSPNRHFGLHDLELVGACGLVLVAAKVWLIGSANTALAFTAPEVQFLFPAPIPRRDLVLYKLGRRQLSLILSAIIITFFVRRAGSPLPPILRVISLWVLFCTLTLHQVAAALMRSGAAQPGRGRRRYAVPLILAGGVLLVLVVLAVRAWPGARSIAALPGALDQVSSALRAPLPSVLLWPFYVALDPSYAARPRAWLLALGPAVALMALHMAWVLREDSTFEDVAVQASALRADRLANARARASGAALPTRSVVTRVSGSMAVIRGDRTPVRPSVRPARFVLPLAPVGNPAVAVLWKNTLALARGLRVRTAVIVAVTMTVMVLAFREAGFLGETALSSAATFLGTLAITAATFLVVMGPLTVRNDLRQDLLHIDVLRALPLNGRQVVFAEIASSALALTALQWCLLIIGYGLLVGGGASGVMTDPPPLFDRPAPGGLLVLVLATLPVINCASFFVQNAAALLFPSWIRLGGTGMGGLEVIGQRILAIGASMLGIAVLLTLPAGAAVAVASLLSGGDSASTTPAALAGGVAALVAVVELYFGIGWLGRRFDTTDASALLPPT